MSARPLRNTTADWQAADTAHHLHPFTNHAELHRIGPRIITKAEGSYLIDSEGKRMLDAFAGLWCVNIGYGRKELAKAAYDQMLELPYYNTFFKTSTPPAAELARVLSEIAPNKMSARLLWHVGIGCQRHHRAHGAPILEPVRQAGEEDHHQPHQRLSRQHHGLGQPGRHELHACQCRSAAARLCPHHAALLVRSGRRA